MTHNEILAAILICVMAIGTMAIGAGIVAVALILKRFFK